MDAREEYNLELYKQTFQKVAWNRFRDNFKRLKKAGFKKGEKEKKAVNPWVIAKPIAHEYYVKEIITDDMTIEEIHAMEPFAKVDFDRFKDNFTKLKKRIKKDKLRADDDMNGYERDIKIHTLAKDTEGEWHGSEAEKLLREDIENGKHEEKKPMKFRLSRDEYKSFELDTFRGHIYQETRRKKESLYWNVKKEKKRKKKQASREGRMYKDDDTDFYDPVLQFVSLDDWE